MRKKTKNAQATMEYVADEKVSPLRPQAAIAARSRVIRFSRPRRSCMLRDTRKC